MLIVRFHLFDSMFSITFYDSEFLLIFWNSYFHKSRPKSENQINKLKSLKIMKLAYKKHHIL